MNHDHSSVAGNEPGSPVPAATRPFSSELAGTLFNGAVNAEARQLVACLSEADVQRAVKTAVDCGLPVAVVGGGHDMWGRGFVESNTIIDLRAMRWVRPDPLSGEVTVGGGALAADLLATLAPDQVAVTGTIMSVGMTGLTLGGGYGTLNGRYGLASDNLRKARVVLADGSIVIASDHENPDLLWALRGGGSGFGVVTEMTLAMHHLPQVLTAMIFVSLDHAGGAMQAAQQLIDTHAHEIGLFMGFMFGPEGTPALLMAPLWTGDAETGESLIGSLAGLTGAQLVARQWTSYKGSFDPEVEKAFPKGAHYHLLTRTLRRLDATTVDVLLEGARSMTSPTQAIVLHDFHGAAASVPADATAFALRDDHFVVEMIAGWQAGDGAGWPRQRWVEQLDSTLAKVALPGGYVPLLAPLEVDRIHQFYGRNSERLREMKARVDPSDLFRTAIGRLGTPAR